MKSNLFFFFFALWYAMMIDEDLWRWSAFMAFSITKYDDLYQIDYEARLKAIPEFRRQIYTTVLVNSQ